MRKGAVRQLKILGQVEALDRLTLRQVLHQVLRTLGREVNQREIHTAEATPFPEVPRHGGRQALTPRKIDMLDVRALRQMLHCNVFQRPRINKTDALEFCA